MASVAAVFLFIVGSLLFTQRPWEQPESLVAENTTDMAVGKRSEPKRIVAATETDAIVASEAGQVSY